jgi:basic amino acid/polyamine antiporter, APA family
MNKKQEKLGLVATTIIGMNAMIGASIFTAPSKLIIAAGPAGLLSYVLVIAAVLLIGTALARVAEYYPEEGSFYIYNKAWGGHKMGIFVAGLYIFGLSLALGLVARVIGIYIYQYYPSISPAMWGIIVTIFITLLHTAGTRANELSQYILLILTLLPMAIISVACLIHANISHLSPFMPHGLFPVFASMQAVIFGFLGFEAIPSLQPLVANPARTLPRALTLSIIFTGIVYMSFVGSIMLGIPGSAFVSFETPLSIALQQVFASAGWVIHLINGAIIITLMGTIHAMMWAIATLLSSVIHLAYPKMAWSSYHSLFSTAAFIILICAVVNNLGLLFDLTALGVVTAYGLSLFPLLQKKHRTTPNVIHAMSALFAAGLILLFAFQNVYLAF